MAKYRVIQWATGGVGRAAIEAVCDHPELELVGCWVHSAEKVGHDAGELAGVGALGVRATGDIEEILALDADCVVYSPILADTGEVVRLLESGKNVVTPVGWVYPFRSIDVTVIEAACHKGGVTLHGTGIHPGGITERLPLTLSALSRAITHVRAEEFSDIRTYNSPGVVSDVMLFGKRPEDAKRSPMLGWLAQGFYQSIDMIAAALGFALDDEKRSTHEMAVATSSIESPIGPLPPGSVAAQRFTWQGMVRGVPVVTARVNWLMGQEHLDPPWTFGTEGERFEVDVAGDPPPSISPCTASIRRRSRRAWRETPGSSPPPCTASAPFPTFVRRRRGSAPISTCR